MPAYSKKETKPRINWIREIGPQPLIPLYLPSRVLLLKLYQVYYPSYTSTRKTSNWICIKCFTLCTVKDELPKEFGVSVVLTVDLIFFVTLIHNDNRTRWNPIRSVIIRVTNKIGRTRSGSPIILVLGFSLLSYSFRGEPWERGWIPICLNHQYNYLPNWMTRSSAIKSS